MEMQMSDVVVKVCKWSKRAKIHGYKHEGDLCFDIGILIGDGSEPETMSGSCIIHEEGYLKNETCSGVECTIAPHSTIKFHTGLSFAAEAGYGIKVHVRSSTGIKKSLVLANGTGIIDNAYRGEVMVALTNTSDHDVTVIDGERIAQGEVVPIYTAKFIEAEVLDETERGVGGIGSTGGH